MHLTFNAWNGCVDQKAKNIIGAELIWEIERDAPGMLRSYVRQIPEKYADMAQPCISVSRQASDIMEAARQENSVEGIMILLTLNHAFTFFLPWLREAGARLGFRDYRYVDEYTGVNQRRAKEFSQALSLQAQALKIPPDKIEGRYYYPVKEIRGLTRNIFSLRNE